MYTEILQKRHIIESPESKSNCGILLGMKGNTLYYENLESLGNILISTSPGYGKTNMLKNILAPILNESDINLTILEEKNIEFTKIDNKNVDYYGGEKVQEGLNNVYQEMLEELKKEENIKRVIVIDELGIETLSEINNSKIECLINNSKNINWNIIIVTMTNLSNINTILPKLDTIISARTPIKEIACLFKEKQQRVRPGQIYVFTKNENIKLNVLFLLKNFLNNA